MQGRTHAAAKKVKKSTQNFCALRFSIRDSFGAAAISEDHSAFLICALKELHFKSFCLLSFHTQTALNSPCIASSGKFTEYT
jgi:hypothetical protein